MSISKIKNQAGFTHPMCRKNPDPYFDRGCGTSNACHFYTYSTGPCIHYTEGVSEI